MSTLAIKLREILTYINGYYLIPVFILGILGNMANIIVFRKYPLKTNSCSLYFLVMSIIYIIVLCFGCLVRSVISLSGFDLTHSSIFFCKFRIYFFLNGMLLSRYFLCLISIDRWLITSLNANIHHQNNLNLSRKITIISLILISLFQLHGPIGFRPELSGCVPSSNGSYLMFYSIQNAIFAIIPLIILIFFTTLTLKRIINRRFFLRCDRNIHPSAFTDRNINTVIQNLNDQDERIARRNIQLIKINSIQVIFFILLNFPNTIYTLYAFITRTYQKTPEQISIDNFFNLMSSNLLYTHCAVCLIILLIFISFNIFIE